MAANSINFMLLSTLVIYGSQIITFTSASKIQDDFCFIGSKYFDGCRDVLCTNVQGKCKVTFADKGVMKPCKSFPEAPAGFYKECIPGKSFFDGVATCYCVGKELTGAPKFICNGGRDLSIKPPLNIWKSNRNPNISTECSCDSDEDVACLFSIGCNYDGPSHFEALGLHY